MRELSQTRRPVQSFRSSETSRRAEDPRYQHDLSSAAPRDPRISAAQALSEIAQRRLDHLALLGRQRRLRRDGIADP